MKYLSLSLCLFAFGLLTSSALAEVQAEGSSDVSGYQSLRGIGVPFVENLGQHPPEVRFYAETFAGTFFVMRDGGMWLAVPNNEGPDKGPFLCVLAKDAQYGNVARERILIVR